MIYQCYFKPEQSLRFFDTPVYEPFGLEPEVNPEIEKNCPELGDKEFRLHLVDFAAMLHLWRNPPQDDHDWIGFTSWRQLDKSKTVFSSAAEIELLLESNDIVSWSRYRWNKSLAAQAEGCHKGITSFLIRMFADLEESIPGEYFEIKTGFYTEYWLMKKPLFNSFMKWLEKFITYGKERIRSDEYLSRTPKKGLGFVLERLFIIWYLKNHWSIYDCKSRKSFIDGIYVTKPPAHKVSLGCVNYKKSADEKILEATRTGRIAGGRFIAELEAKFCDKLGTKHAIAVCNGTMADAIALSAVATKTNRKNVITPALTFIAQVNAIVHAGLNPVFVDVGKEGLLEDISGLVDGGDCIIYPTHLMGKVCKSIKNINNQHAVIEDTCEALGSRINGQYAGTLGMVGTFSMYVSHSFTCGEGGMIVTNDDQIAEICRSIRTHGRRGEGVEERFCFPRLGFNGKMSNIQAAFATAHFDDLDQTIEKRKEVVAKLASRLGDDFGVASNDVVAHAFPVKYADKAARDKALSRIGSDGVECRPLFSCVASEHFNTSGHFPNAKEISSRFLYVPCHHQMTQREIDLVCKAVSDSQTAR